MIKQLWKNNWPLFVWASLIHTVLYFSFLFIRPEIGIGKWWEHLIGCIGIFILLKVEQFWNKQKNQNELKNR